MSGVEHAPLAPSAAVRWGVCAGSARAEANSDLPVSEKDDLSAREGNAAHAFAYQAFTTGELPIVGKSIAPGGIVADQEMVEAVIDHVDYIHAHAPASSGIVEYETPVTVPAIHADCWGTPDVVWWTVNGLGDAYIHVFDFKYGHGFVDVHRNYQLICYAWGHVEKLLAMGIPLARINVALNIIQPRNWHPSGHFRTMKMAAKDMVQDVVHLRSQAIEAMSSTPKLKAGPHCSDCKARHHCRALHDEAQTAMDVAANYSMSDMPDEALGVELLMMHRAAALLKAKISGMETDAEARLKSGKHVPFFELGRTDPREAWMLDAPTVFALGDSIGVDLRKPPAALTPQQSIKAVKAAGMDESILTGLYNRPPGTIKIQRTNDTLAKRIFTQ